MGYDQNQHQIHIYQVYIGTTTALIGAIRVLMNATIHLKKSRMKLFLLRKWDQCESMRLLFSIQERAGISATQDRFSRRQERKVCGQRYFFYEKQEVHC